MTRYAEYRSLNRTQEKSNSVTHCYLASNCAITECSEEGLYVEAKRMVLSFSTLIIAC